METHRLLDSEYYRLSICGMKNKNLILEEELLRTQIEIANKRISEIRRERGEENKEKELILDEICGRIGINKNDSKYEIRLQSSPESSSISVEI